jgi:hypothetical protein
MKSLATRARVAIAAAVLAAVTAAPAFVPSPAAANGTYPLVCRGGGPISIHYSRTYDEITVRFTAGTGPAYNGLLAGQCSWEDRGFRPGEPTMTCQTGITNLDAWWGNASHTGTSNSTQAQYVGQLRNSFTFWRFGVYNDGRCMRVVWNHG